MYFLLVQLVGKTLEICWKSACGAYVGVSWFGRFSYMYPNLTAVADPKTGMWDTFSYKWRLISQVLFRLKSMEADALRAQQVINKMAELERRAEHRGKFLFFDDWIFFASSIVLIHSVIF